MVLDFFSGWLKLDPNCSNCQRNKSAFACLVVTVSCSQSSPAAIQKPRKIKTNFFSKLFECVSKLLNFALWWNYWGGHGCDPVQSASGGCSGSVAAFEAPELNHALPKPFNGEKLGTLTPFQGKLSLISCLKYDYTSHTCHQCVLPDEGKHVRQMGRSNREMGSVMRLYIYS